MGGMTGTLNAGAASELRGTLKEKQELNGTLKEKQRLNGRVVSVGEDGGYYTPAFEQLDADTMQVSFAASKEDMPPIEPQNIALLAGYTPQKGIDYQDGKDGASVTVQSVEESTADGGSNVVTFSDGKKLNVKNGSKGSPGYTPVKGVDYNDGEDGKDGKDGYTPVKGTDYFTTAEIDAVATQAAGKVTPSGIGAATATHPHSAADITSGTLPIERGGTGADTAAGARQNINVIGLNPITASANDTPEAWKAFGTGIAYFNKANCIVGQPTTNGLIENKVYNNTVLQEWFVRGTAPRKFIRTGQSTSTSWNSSWVDISIAGQTDYVTATGTSGVWTYWKFNSGLCIAMGQPTVSWGTATQVVSGQTRSTVAIDLSGIFTAVLGGTCSNAHRYVNCFVTTGGGTSAELWATTAVASGTVNVSNFSTTPFVVLFGKWK